MEKTDQKILEIIKSRTEREKISELDHLKNDLGINSIDLVEIIVEMEEIFSVCFFDDKIEKIETVKDVLALAGNCSLENSLPGKKMDTVK